MGRILFVDDDKDILELGRLHFEESFGVEVICAFSGNEGKRILKRRSDFDVIISDYNMPNGDGLELLEYKLSLGIQIPFLFFTNETSLQIPYSPSCFIGVFPKMRFQEICDSIGAILRKEKS